MISLKNGVRHDRPYPYAIFDDVIPFDKYDQLVEQFPVTLAGDRLGGHRYHKGYLSDRHQGDQFRAELDNRPAWADICAELRGNFASMAEVAFGPFGFSLKDYTKPSLAIEFSSLPAEGGGLKPHPDNAKKIVTAVLFIEPDWNREWGGGFEVLQRPDRKQEVDLAPWSEVETVEVVHVRPRRMVFMQRTPISYHGVRPLHSPRNRRSMTINLIAKHK